MPDIFDIDPMSKYLAFFVGPNGCGKSIAIASWMKKGSVYTFDYDGRMNSVANWYLQRGLKRGQLIYDSYGPKNLFQALEKLDSFIEYCPHAAISIDSFTAVTVSAVMGSLGQRTKSSNQASSKGGLTIPDWDEWNGEATYVTMMLDLCKTLASKGVAVFWTGHPVTRMKIVGKNYSTQTKYAAFGMKSDSLIPIYFNEIYHFAVDFDPISGEKKRICITSPDGEVNAKTAMNLPDKIDWTNKNFYEIFEVLAKESQEKLRKKGETKDDVVETKGLDLTNFTF